MKGLLDLTNSERGILGLALIVAATVLCGLGRMSVEQWMGFSTGAYVIYAGAKTVSHVTATLKGKGGA